MSGFAPGSALQARPGSPGSQHSQSPEPGDGRDTKHRRNYQACEGCRIRKVKCDLGPVDAPHPPPCKRCRRENKTCEFADTRKKRKNSPDDSADGYPDKRARTISDTRDSPFTQHSAGYNGDFSPHDWSMNIQPGLQSMTAQPPAQPASTTPHNHPRSHPPLMSPTSRPMLRSVAQHNIHGPAKRESHDEVKSQAAEHLIGDPMTTSQKSFGLIISAANALDAKDNAVDQKVDRRELGSAGMRRNLDGSAYTPQQLADYKKALEVWNSMTFVRSDFFSAEEAIAYIEYFYDNLQPMTPVVVPDYRGVSKHLTLLTEEPILALTILTIASRHKVLSGFSELSRRYQIHENLWRSLTSKVQRLLWGQEQFGGGRAAVGAGKVRELAGGQLTWSGSLRTLGTIEALLVLTDWQPRALHFPPGNDDIRLLDRNLYDSADGDIHQSYAQAKTGSPNDNMPYASWLEPAWRSDRMSWMLLGLAHSLAYELGVFDEPSGRLYDNDPDLLRKNRIRRMVTVYVAQTSGRIGIPSPVGFDDDYTGRMLEAQSNEPVDVVHGLWTHIAGIMHQANKLIFPSREYTMNLTRGKEYRDRIETFAPQLIEWKEHYDRVRGSISPVMQCILIMEYEYARLYINSIGLQHVVESWVRPGASAQKSASSNMAKSVAENRRYIDEFTEAALHILEIVSGKMKQLGVLRDAPVRTFLRTLSAMMFTLKRLSLGNHERLVRKSIGLLEQVIQLFQTEVVDDVHLSGSTALMIEGILKKVKQTMIRVQKPPHTSSVPSRDQSRPGSPQHQANDRTQEYLEAATQQYANGMRSNNAAYSMDPLASIQARPLADFSDRTFIMPHGWSVNDFDGTLMMDDTAIDPSVNSEGNADWLALPLDNFEHLSNNDTVRVDQGMHSIGPTIGQQDLMEVMLDLPSYEQNGMPWPGTNHGFQNY
ncbi:uncharacterized protein HMPREF1541_10003 [Cyphellophora europaea CBS 101466]|uniref:Zn(2)-C6 fungal-type domain-containing protein n=1 Tax=Cyphellophora europaea (strain CBS 101466) TaxID=1220924 RepID=W2S8S1_CYPE1|nr:uncharacterized protein HMPREF1541_10003 [Cyphellophora europaea CBS 101466]ETN45126.1 hypothetical protein HMPREF1541_10003 [Cyphellophora europaea CBS 101466]